MSVDSAFAAALWNPFFAQTKIRPEWIVPVLMSESGLNPGIQNSQGYPFYGLNQIAGTWLQARGIDPKTYLTWPASQQLTQVVTPFMVQQVAALGITPQSGTRAYQMNFLPATLKTAKTLDSVLATKPSGGCPPGRSNSVYCANQVFDYQKKGTITVGDLAHFVAKNAANSYVQQVIASAYAVAPAGVGPETDPVYGLDFPDGASPSSGPISGTDLVLIAIALAAAGGAAYIAMHPGVSLGDFSPARMFA